MFPIKIILAILFLFFFTVDSTPLSISSCLAEKFEHITIEQGLSQSTIGCIFQDSRGFMWFGTQGGLDKYDGYNFTIYKPIPNDPGSLSGHEVNAICEDSYGALWVGTRCGLNRFDPQKERFQHFNVVPGDFSSLSCNQILCLLEDSQGELWIGTVNGLNKYNRGKNSFVRYKHRKDHPYSLSHNYVLSIFEDSYGMLWIGTMGGLNRYDRRSDKFSCYCNDPQDPTSLSHSLAQCIGEDRAGSLWVGTLKGLNRFDRKTERFTRFVSDPNDPFSLSHNDIQDIYEDRYGTLWIATQLGLNKYDREREQFFCYAEDMANPDSLSQNYTTCIYEDRSGVLWIGTESGGLNKLLLKNKPFTHYQVRSEDSFGFRNDGVFAIYEDRQGLLWVGTDYSGLYRFNRETEKFTRFQAMPDNPDTICSNRVYSIFEDRQGTLWIGTDYGGLCKFDRQKNRFIRFKYDPHDPDSISDNRILAIYEDSSGELWIGGWRGLNRFDRKTGRFTHFSYNPADPHSISNNNIYAIFEDRTGILWIGTFNGLNKFDRQSRKFVRYQHDINDPTSLSHSSVNSIYEDRSGTLWVGTLSGLNRFNRETGTFTFYTEMDGLPNDTIYGILEDDQGKLWLSTNKGLSAFSPRTVTFKNYTKRVGLQGNEFNWGAYYKGRRGELFFGGLNGITAFHPERIKDNPHIPPILITNFQIYNKSVPIESDINGRMVLQKSITETRHIEVSYRQNNFTFEFAALDYISPEENQYAFIMEGFEKEWNYVGNRRIANYIKIPPGEYVFKVKGSNNDGVWNEAGTAISIKVTPPFWVTWWFRVTILATILLVILALYKKRTYSIRKRNRELSEINIRLNEQISVRERTEMALKKSHEQLRNLSNHLESVREEERLRIAREIHDELGQSLTALKMDISWVKKKLDGKHQLASQKITSIIDQTDLTIQTVKKISSDLRPRLLDDLGLSSAIQWQTDEFQKRTGIRCLLNTRPEEIILNKTVSTAIFRISQEALTNVQRHAGATQVKVDLFKNDRKLTLKVSDNGCGISRERKSSPRSFGLIGIQERVYHLGGRFKINGQRGVGTTLHVTIPLDKKVIRSD